MTTSNPRPLLSPEVVEAIRARRPFEEGWLVGYITEGGTYIVASPSRITDSGKPRDLLAVLPSDLGHGRVVPLYLATNPDTVVYLEQQLAARSNSTERSKVHPDAAGDR